MTAKFKRRLRDAYHKAAEGPDISDQLRTDILATLDAVIEKVGKEKTKLKPKRKCGRGTRGTKKHSRGI
jgi:hypothetical protein